MREKVFAVADWVFWVLLAAVGISMLMSGVNAEPVSSWDRFWQASGVTFGLLAFVSGAGNAGMFWWRTSKREEISAEEPQLRFPHVEGQKGARRDRIVVSLVNWILTTFATSKYLDFLHLLMSLGRAELERKLKDESEPADAEFLSKPES